MTASAATFGIVSDTHGRVDPAIFELFRGVDAIVHAGDLGSEEVLVELQAIAPVLAVHGNVDTWPLNHRLPKLGVYPLGPLKAVVVHDAGRVEDVDSPGQPAGLADPVRLALEREAPDVVVFGHTHHATAVVGGRVLYFNPGSSSSVRRRGDRRGVGLIRVEDGRIVWKLVPLDGTGGREGSVPR